MKIIRRKTLKTLLIQLTLFLSCAILFLCTCCNFTAHHCQAYPYQTVPIVTHDGESNLTSRYMLHVMTARDLDYVTPRDDYQMVTSQRNLMKSQIIRHHFLIVILSATRNSAVRQELRTKGWVKHIRQANSGTNQRFGYVFVVGFEDGYDVTSEVERYGDILLWPGPDSYRNIVYKLAWVLEKVRGLCFDFLVKVDDDSLVHLGGLSALVAEQDGNLQYGGECIREKVVERQGKYGVSRGLYSHSHYPTYMAGAGYILSAALVLQLQEVWWRVPLFPVEDAYVGVLINRFSAVQPTCLPTFHHRDWREKERRADSAVILHKVKLGDIKSLTETVYS